VTIPIEDELEGKCRRVIDLWCKV